MHIDLRPRVVVLSRAGEDSLTRDGRASLSRHARLTFVQRDDAPTADRAAQLLEGAHVLGSTNVTLPALDAGLLRRLPELRHVVLYATGYDHVDVDLLADHGVGLSVLPEYATTAVAEHAAAMMFALAARVHLANDRSLGRVDADVSLRGFELRGRRLGIIGVGLIGRELARIARGIGMDVVGHDVDPGARAEGVPMTSAEALVAGSDVVAVCASTVAGTPRPLSADRIARLRPGASVVCVGRPGLVDLDALRPRLLDGSVRGYAVDEVVLDPLDPVDRCLGAEGRVLQTAHSAWWRDEVLARGAAMFGDALLAAALGRPVHVVPAGRREPATAPPAPVPVLSGAAR